MNRYIFFVHGYSTNSKKTWGDFVKYLTDNEKIEYEIDYLDYKSPAKWQIWKTAPSLYNIAEGLITKLKHKCDLENDEIVLIGHSNGGVVIKKLLERLSLNKIEHNISKVCFLDVPHHGSGYASAGKIINPRNQHVKSLPLNSVDLLEINDYWVRDDMQSQFEVLNLVADDDDVVSSMSSRFNIPESITIPNTNHETIAKPASAESEVVLEVEKFILEDKPLKKFITRASKSYRDWRRLDRHHSLGYVADEAREDAFQSLCDALDSAKPLVRLTGLSGLGKTRLLIEYINNFELPEQNILIYDASQEDGEILTSIGSAVDAEVNGLVIIENCEVKLHDAIEKIYDTAESKLKVVTVSFYHDKVNDSVHIKLEKLRSEKVLELIREILPDAAQSEVERIERFVEGFPLLAEMITIQLLKEGAISADFTERDLVEKLINGDGSLSEESRELLKVFSLFDYFPYQNAVHNEGEQPVEFINKIAGTGQRDFDYVITNFTSREIIICTGLLARIVPKPLALNLAMEWWNSSLFERQSELISGLPPSMLESFCSQIKYLDNSINVQSFVESFLDAERPFGQAELLLSKKGSRLFRSLVEVNPKATSESLYRIFELLDDDAIRNISGDVRRNLIWALEMLCFHKSYFLKSSWCLFRLACFENESYSNNATGQWSQLFRWQLSGTEANFEQRLDVIHRALQLDSKQADMVVIEAIKSAISTFGGSRTIGAEFQGTKPEMKEWRPEVWQEIFDYWQKLFDILVALAEKPYALEAVKEAVGHEIRGIVGPGTIDMLDKTITKIIQINGKYWPSASQSIVHALEYDADKMKKDILDALLSWQERLSPDADNFKERITLIVLDPSREHEEGPDGKLIDRAAEEAIAFARELTSVDELNKNIEFILGFKEQKQSWVFGRELALGLSPIESHSLFSVLIDVLLQVNVSRFEFVSGYLSGIYTKDEDAWLECVNIFCTEEKLFRYYPQAVRSGKCTIDQLHVFIKLVREGILESSETAMFSYGRAVEHLSEEDVVYFCNELSQISPKATWGALDILSMYMFGRDDYDFEKIKPTLEQLLLSVSFNKEDKLRHTNGYHWLKSVEKILANNDLEFAQLLVKELVDKVTKSDIDYSDLWDVFHPAFYKAFEYYANEIWPSFSKEILLVTEHRRQRRLQELFGSGKESRRKTNSIFTLIDEGIVVDWCENETALMYVARSLKLFDSTGEERVPNSLLIRLVDVYGQNQDLLSEIRVNFHTRSWSGSIIPGFQSDKTALQPLLEHESHAVRQWASDFVSMIDNDIDKHNKQESEERFARGM